VTVQLEGLRAPGSLMGAVVSGDLGFDRISRTTVIGALAELRGEAQQGLSA
jgi:hypothetical protein